MPQLRTKTPASQGEVSRLRHGQTVDVVIARQFAHRHHAVVAIGRPTRELCDDFRKSPKDRSIAIKQSRRTANRPCRIERQPHAFGGDLPTKLDLARDLRLLKASRTVAGGPSLNHRTRVPHPFGGIGESAGSWPGDGPPASRRWAVAGLPATSRGSAHIARWPKTRVRAAIAPPRNGRATGRPRERRNSESRIAAPCACASKSSP